MLLAQVRNPASVIKLPLWGVCATSWKFFPCSWDCHRPCVLSALSMTWA